MHPLFTAQNKSQSGGDTIQIVGTVQSMAGATVEVNLYKPGSYVTIGAALSGSSGGFSVKTPITPDGFNEASRIDIVISMDGYKRYRYNLKPAYSYEEVLEPIELGTVSLVLSATGIVPFVDSNNNGYITLYETTPRTTMKTFEFYFVMTNKAYGTLFSEGRSASSSTAGLLEIGRASSATSKALQIKMGSGTSHTTKQFEFGKLYHLVVSRSSYSSAALYVNGVLEQSITYAGSYSSLPTLLGKSNYGTATSYMWDKPIALYREYTGKALSATEVAALYNDGDPLNYKLPENLVAACTLSMMPYDINAKPVDESQLESWLAWDYVTGANEYKEPTILNGGHVGVDRTTDYPIR